MSGCPLRDGAGPVYGGVVFFQDVTQRRQEVQAITLLSRVVEQTADSVMLTDKQGTIEYVNPAFVTTSGYPVAEVLGETPRILKSGLHDAGFYSQLWSRLMGGQTFRGMIINRKKSGELYWAQQTITPVRDQGGELTHFVSVLQDITELRKQEEHDFQLRLAREVQQQFYGSAPGVAGFDLGGSSYPAYETGGDYFDFIAMPNGRLGIALGDVEGHGFGSALVMALTRAYLRSFASLDLELEQILVRVNRMLAQDLEHGHFVTLALACLDTSRRSLIYAGAGHMPGFVLSSSGVVRACPRKQRTAAGTFFRQPVFLPEGDPARTRADRCPADRRDYRVGGSRRRGIRSAGRSRLYRRPSRRARPSNRRRSSPSGPKICRL